MSASSSVRVVFGLVASSREDSVASFEAFAAWMRESAGIELESKVAPSYQALSTSIREGSSDVAWLPPVVYAWLAEAVTPLGCINRAGMTSYYSALVVDSASQLSKLEDLRGARAGWVDPWSAAGFVVPRIELARADFDPTTTFRSETFYGSHRDALEALAQGRCDVVGTYAHVPKAGGPVEGAWSEVDRLEVRVLATYGPIPPDVIAVRRNLLPSTHERLLDALRRACADEASRPLVRAVFGGHELSEGVETGHEALRRAVERAIANGLFD